MDHEPAAHAAHVAPEAAPTAADHVPAAQGVGEVDAEGQKKPAGHAAHALPFT